MYEKPPLFWVRCPYCGHTIGLATELEMYHQSFRCNACSQSIKTDPFHSKQNTARRKSTRYYDI